MPALGIEHGPKMLYEMVLHLRYPASIKMLKKFILRPQSTKITLHNETIDFNINKASL